MGTNITTRNFWKVFLFDLVLNILLTVPHIVDSNTNTALLRIKFNGFILSLLIKGNGMAVVLLHSQFVSKYHEVGEEEVDHTALYS